MIIPWESAFWAAVFRWWSIRISYWHYFGFQSIACDKLTGIVFVSAQMIR